MKDLSVMFLSEMCVLDKNSGAAIEMNDWLSCLADFGAKTSSVSMSLFDGTDEYPFQLEIAPTVDVKSNIGSRIRLHKDGTEHNIYNVGTSVGRKVGKELVRGFIKAAAEDIARIKPDIVIGFGSPNLVTLRKFARELGAKSVFYLANDSYTSEKVACFDEIDRVVTPSRALANLYKDRLGLSCDVIGNYLHSYNSIKRPTVAELDMRRKSGFITMVNPSIVKGGLFFLQIAAVLEKLRPQYTFLAIESRTQREHLESYVKNSNKLSNIWWLQRQSDMARVYTKSGILLMPSLWFEAAGRVVPEAQLHGVPVIAHKVGALPEQVGNGGKMIPVPQRFAAGFEKLPSPEEITPWVKAIDSAFSNSRSYRELSDRALVASANHNPIAVGQEIKSFCAKLLSNEQ